MTEAGTLGRARWWVVVILNVLLLPLYTFEVFNVLQIGFIPGAMIAVVMIAGLALAWPHWPRVAASVQLALMSSLLIEWASLEGSFNTAGLAMSDFLDWRVVVLLLLAIVVPALLSTIALTTIVRRTKAS